MTTNTIFSDKIKRIKILFIYFEKKCGEKPNNAEFRVWKFKDRGRTYENKWSKRRNKLNILFQSVLLREKCNLLIPVKTNHVVDVVLFVKRGSNKV